MPRLQVARQRMKASRRNGANESHSARIFHRKLHTVARAHTRDTFVLRDQEM